jgi:hypothetical protein
LAQIEDRTSMLEDKADVLEHEYEENRKIIIGLQADKSRKETPHIIL